MPRPLRLEYPGALWHVMNRGVERRDIFHDDSDRLRFLDLLGETVDIYRWHVLVYTLMTNHFHLVIETPLPTLAIGMQRLTGDYANVFNRRHHRAGHLFQSRFRSLLVEKETYLLELARYVVLNPVRAGMVAAPGDWPWSSYHAAAGLCAAPAWLHLDPILNCFDARDRMTACHRYRAFVAAGVGLQRTPWEEAVAGAYLGSASFLDRLRRMTENSSWRPSHPQRQRSATATPLAQVRAAVEDVFQVSVENRSWRAEEARLAFALLGRNRAVATFSRIAAAIGVSTSGARAITRRAETLRNSSPSFSRKLDLTLMRITECKVRV